MKQAQYLIYSDGACIGNPGPGGWAAIIREPDGTERVLTGSATQTTNSRMELRAALEALRSVPEGKHVHVLLRTDSRYLADAIGKGWALRWRQQGWRRNRHERAENVDLWEQLLAELDRRTVQTEWVKAHNGDPLNERCDALARKSAEHATGTDEGYLQRTTLPRQEQSVSSIGAAVQCTQLLDGRIAISDGTATVTVDRADIPTLVSQLVRMLENR